MLQKTLRLPAVSAVLAAAIFGVAGHAQAGVSITSAGNAGYPTGQSITIVTFDNTPLGNASQVFSQSGVSATVTFTGDAGIVNGSASGLYAMPYPNLAGPDTTNYASTGIGTVSFAFNVPQDYFGMLWGSVDTYNSLSFYDASGNLITSLTGADVTASANGDQGFLGTYYVNFSSDILFSTVVASSSGYAFEFDDVAFDPPGIAFDQPGEDAPEPASLALLGAGALTLAALRRRR